MNRSQIAQQVERAVASLTPAERRVADVVISDPEAIAFGTVAEVARSAGASGATVVRLAAKLGFDGYAALQEAVQGEVARRLRPATERIREPAPGDVAGHTLQAALDAVHGTLSGIAPETFAAVVSLLVNQRSRVWLISGEEGIGAMRTFADRLRSLQRPHTLVVGSAVRVAELGARVGSDGVIVALDLRRYDRWVCEWVERAKPKASAVVAMSDSLMSPLAVLSDHHFVVEAEGAGPFDTYVGAMALLDALVNGVAARSRAEATAALDEVEEAWQVANVLRD